LPKVKTVASAPHRLMLMRVPRRLHRRLSGWLSAALLLMQLAVAAYACPAALAQSLAPVATVEMPDCAGRMPAAMDADQPLLCQAHCQQGSQTAQPTPAADATPAPVLLGVLDWTQALHVPGQPADRRPLLRPGASRPGSPPLYLRLLVLRN
jgi:hypothetical protein